MSTYLRIKNEKGGTVFVPLDPMGHVDKVVEILTGAPVSEMAIEDHDEPEGSGKQLTFVKEAVLQEAPTLPGPNELPTTMPALYQITGEAFHNGFKSGVIQGQIESTTLTMGDDEELMQKVQALLEERREAERIRLAELNKERGFAR